MIEMARKAAKKIQQHRNDSITIVSHMDADGVSAAALASLALDRQNIEHQVKFVRMIYRDVVENLEPDDLTIFTDLGSSQLQLLKEKFSGQETIIADHHKPEKADGWPELVHLNAHLGGLNGVEEISGAGVTYLIARELDPSNQDLSALAIVGAVGDVQNVWGSLRGYNRKIAQDGINAEMLEQKKDLLFYGRHTRPIFRTLEGLTDPPIPGVSNSVEGCVSLLKDLNIPYKKDRGWRRPVDLTDEEKQRLATELITRAIAHVPEELVKYVPGLIIGEVHTLLKEKKRPMLRDADEFATCINATAKHEQPLIGLEVAKGDQSVYYRAMLKLLKYHRRCIAEGMNFVGLEGIERGPKGYLQYFDATGVLKKTFVGTIASLSIGHPACEPYKPIVGFVRESGVAKFSARCSKLLFLRGFDLAQAIRAAARSVGGEGGGHAVACGAEVDEEKVPQFLQEFENNLLTQL